MLQCKRRTGYEEPALRRMFAQYGIETRMLYPGQNEKVGGKRQIQRIYVEIDAVLAAIESDARYETVRAIALRNGLSHCVVWRWLRLEGVLKPAKPGESRKHQRVETKIVEAIIEKRKPAYERHPRHRAAARNRRTV